MPELRIYDLFISHAWKYDDDYDRLVRMLEGAANFLWRNLSVPRHDPLFPPTSIVGRARLHSALDEQIRRAQCVLVIAGMYAHHRDWIQTEIDIANGYHKPIVAVEPWGQLMIPASVRVAADEIVGWRTERIVGAIRRRAL